jgi:hypothetical protein
MDGYSNILKWDKICKSNSKGSKNIFIMWTTEPQFQTLSTSQENLNSTGLIDEIMEVLNEEIFINVL